jgi:hypothetical protein
MRLRETPTARHFPRAFLPLPFFSAALRLCGDNPPSASALSASSMRLRETPTARHFPRAFLPLPFFSAALRLCGDVAPVAPPVNNPSRAI